MLRFLIALLFLARAAPQEDLRAGLVARYRSLEKEGGELVRIDLKPAFALGHGSPHPRIAPGGFEVVWTGLLLLQDAEPVSFGATVGGEVTLTLDGTTVLEARSERENAWSAGAPAREWKPGLHPIEIRYRSLAGIPARLKIEWEGKTFAREPLPAWRLKHRDADVRPDPAARGRELVGRYGCARCHAQAFPGVDDPPPGPSLAGVGDRVGRTWLLAWLADPSALRTGARMPGLFSNDRRGLVERWIIADYLLRTTAQGVAGELVPGGDHRLGKRDFMKLGCFTCHFIPDEEQVDQDELGRVAFQGLNDRMSPKDLASFLVNPHARYPDGRMPRLSIPPDSARDIAAYVLLWNKPPMQEAAVDPPVTKDEVAEVGKRLGVRGAQATASALVAEKRCAQCHIGVAEKGGDVPIKNPQDACRGPRFALAPEAQRSIGAYLAVASRERYPSPFESRQRMLRRIGCERCHQRDGDRPPVIEQVGSTVGGAFLQALPFQRTPRIANPLSKYTRSYLVSTLREGLSGLRGPVYSYRMPAFGTEAEQIIQALGEGDGDLAELPEPVPPAVEDPTLGNVGPSLVGFEGYSCVSCHVWNGQRMSEADPGALGPELTSTTSRIRRDWFDRWMDEPARIHPGSPMPQLFKRGQLASLRGVLEGDAARQKEAIWAYLAKGKDAPSPKPLLPLEIGPPREGPLVAQIPVTLPDKKVVESVTVLFPSHDLLVFDVGSMSLRNVYAGATLLRHIRGRIRTYSVVGTAIGPDLTSALGGTFLGYDRLPDGVRIRSTAGEESIRLEGRAIKAGARTIALPAAQAPPAMEHPVLADPGRLEGPMERPGYRAIAYPRPRTVSGEDLVMPGSIAIHPRDGRVFVASMKLGEIFTVVDPTDDGKGATFQDYAGGLFLEAYGMMAESDGLYVLHRRNLTHIVEKDGVAERFDRVVALPQAVAEAYDYPYGLVRDTSGAFNYTLAQYGNNKLPGAGSLLRHVPGEKPEEVAYGFRNPLGWCAGPGGTIFFTDNQGEWVATNKLSAIVPGRFYGYPNNGQKEHAKKPMGRPAVWVPYGWAHSINGVTYDTSGGKFGPFAGQFFMAEIMFGGAIIRASVEQVNGEWQGCAFPFWGKGLLGPLTLAFDPKGRLWVGSITEPGWMAQPDRGGLFRIDFTGEVPFEMKEVRILPQGFRVVFTRPVDARTAKDPASWAVEHYRYEYTGQYGSPELDRTHVATPAISVSPDGLQVDVMTDPLVRDRVYLLTPKGVRSPAGESLANPLAAYTVNDIPR